MFGPSEGVCVVDSYEWGPAEVGFPDWKGTIQLDEKMTGDDSIYTLTGVDRDVWQIVGLDIGAGESGTFQPHVIAVRRSQLTSKVSEVDQLDVADIQIHGVDAFELLSKITHVMDLRMRVRSVEAARLTVTERLDVPPQE